MNRDLTAVIPLESDPVVFDKFAQRLGLGSGFNFIDIYSIDDENLLAFLQRPVIAIVLLFPVQKKSTIANINTTAVIPTEQPVWLKQNFKNACGFYALLHILINNKDLLRDDSVLLNYIKENESSDMNIKLNQFIIDFVDDNQSEFVNNSGSSENPSPDDVIDLHFITYVSSHGKLWELDGRSKERKPYLIGNVQSQESRYVDLINEPLIKQRILQYMNSVENENEKLNFSLIGFAKSYD